MKYNREVEDGFGCRGLIPTKAERTEERERLRNAEFLKTLRQIAEIAHAGGSQGMSESAALIEIRRLSAPYWKRTA